MALAGTALGCLVVLGAMGACDESTPPPSALPPADLVAPDAAADGPADGASDVASDAQSSDRASPPGDASPGDGALDAPAFVDVSSDATPGNDAASDLAPDAEADAPDESSLSTDDGGPPSAPDAGDSRARHQGWGYPAYRRTRAGGSYVRIGGGVPTKRTTSTRHDWALHPRENEDEPRSSVSSSTRSPVAIPRAAASLAFK